MVWSRQAVEAQGSPTTCFWAFPTTAPRRGTTPVLNEAASAWIPPTERLRGAVPGHARKYRPKQPQWRDNAGAQRRVQRKHRAGDDVRAVPPPSRDEGTRGTPVGAQRGD